MTKKTLTKSDIEFTVSVADDSWTDTVTFKPSFSCTVDMTTVKKSNRKRKN